MPQKPEAIVGSLAWYRSLVKMSGEFMLPELCIVASEGGLLASHVAHYREVLKRIEPTDDIMDVGCGCGLAVRAYRMVTEGRVVAIDKRPAIHVAQHLYWAPGVEYLQTDLNKDPLPDGSFDLVTCTDVYEHLNERRGLHVIDMIRERLTEEGRLVMSVPFGCEGPDGGHFHLRKFQEYEELTTEVSARLLPSQRVIVIRGWGVAAKANGTMEVTDV